MYYMQQQLQPHYPEGGAAENLPVVLHKQTSYRCSECYPRWLGIQAFTFLLFTLQKTNPKAQKPALMMSSLGRGTASFSPASLTDLERPQTAPAALYQVVAHSTPT